MPDKITQEAFLCFWKGGKLVAIERKNGHMERYMTEEADWGNSVDLFGAGGSN